MADLDWVDGVEPKKLRAALKRVLDEFPDAVSVAKAELGLSPEGPPKAPEVNLDQISRSMAGACRDAYRGRYPDPTMVGREAERLLEPAAQAVAAGNPSLALAIHDAVWSAIAAHQGGFWQDECELSDLLRERGADLAAVILAADLDDARVESLERKIEGWREALAGDCLEDALDLPRDALELVRDNAGTADALSGRLERGALRPSERDRWGNEHRLLELRFQALEANGDWDAYLNLARAADDRAAESAALIRLDRAGEAAAAFRAAPPPCDVALETARRFAEAGQRDTALEMARLALEQAPFRGPVAECYELAHWARETATAGGLTASAIEFGRVELRALPMLESYLDVKALAGDDWAGIRDGVVADVMSTTAWGADRVRILVYEDRIAEAVELLGPSPENYYELEIVAPRAVETHPEWALEACLAQFNRIADRGRSAHYHHAGEWMAHVKTAMQNAGRGAEWPEFIAGMLAKHSRKSALKAVLAPLLRA